MATAQKIDLLMQSPAAKKLIAQEEARLQERRNEVVADLERRMAHAEQEHESSSKPLNARIDAAQRAVSVAADALHEKQATLRTLMAERMQRSFAVDHRLGELQAKIEAVRSGNDVQDA